MPKPARPRMLSEHESYRRSETRAVEFLTVGWMVAMMTTLACLVVLAILRSLALRPDAEPAGTLAGLALFASVVAGVLTLTLSAIVVGMRREKPPRRVVWFALIVGIVPLVIVLGQTLASAW